MPKLKFTLCYAHMPTMYEPNNVVMSDGH